MEEKERARRCKQCPKLIRSHNESGLCSHHNTKKKLKENDGYKKRCNVCKKVLPSKNKTGVCDRKEWLKDE